MIKKFKTDADMLAIESKKIMVFILSFSGEVSTE